MAMKDGMNAFERAIKRIFDVVCSFLGLVVLSPLFLVIFVVQLAQRRKGGAIFSQKRIGYKGRTFRIYKFRTMYAGSESDGEPKLAVKDDERLTRVGKFLREYHLDELPQLYNVLIGDMSFVGPRPEREYFIDKIREKNPDYDYVFLMRPGLTSKATIYNGYTDTMEKMLVRLEMDLDYLQNRSLWVDIKIIATTALYIIGGKKF